MSAPFSLDGVSRWYGEVIALNGVSLAGGGGVVGLLGPNGAGKTTLLRLLSGQIRPSLGQVRVLGVEPFANPALYRRVGIAPDGESLPETLSGAAFLRAVAGMNGLGPAEARRQADQALDRVGLSEAAGRRIGGYSKGMRQRLKLAQAVLHEPEILLLDEPLSGLDPLARHDIMALVRAWAERGGSVLVSSHILREVESMTRRVVFLVDGRVRAEGEIGEIRELIESEPRRILVRASDAKTLAGELLRVPHVTGLSFSNDGSSLEIRARRPSEVVQALVQAALSLNITIEELRPEDEDLESIFAYLVRRP